MSGDRTPRIPAVVMTTTQRQRNVVSAVAELAQEGEVWREVAMALATVLVVEGGAPTHTDAWSAFEMAQRGDYAEALAVLA
jgi:hypothetical protein